MRRDQRLSLEYYRLRNVPQKMDLLCAASPLFRGSFPSIAIPKIDLRRKFAALTDKISARFSAVVAQARTISWRRPAMAAGGVVLVMLVVHVARLSGAEAGKAMDAAPAH